MTDSIQVFDDFLVKEIFEPFAFSSMSNWMYAPVDSLTSEEESDGSIMTFGEQLDENPNFAQVMFQCVYLKRFVNQLEISDYLQIHPWYLDIFTDLLNVKKWWMMRINCTVGQPKAFTGAFHVDFPQESFKNTKTAIFYLNSNNGGTKFEETGETIQSKRNRLVKFPTHTKHASVSATNAKLRYVLNMTYEENDNS